MNKQGLHIIGLHTFKKCSIVTEEAKRLETKVRDVLKNPLHTALEFRYWYEQLLQFMTYAKTYKNLVVTTGLEVLANRLGDNTYTTDSYINYGALGDTGTAVALTDTILANETYRKTVEDRTVSSNVVTVTTFWDTTEANVHHYEAGEFINATATANSGILFARWLIDENKTSSETLSIESEYTITQ